MSGVANMFSGGGGGGGNAGAFNTAAMANGLGDLETYYGRGAALLQPFQKAGAGALPQLSAMASKGFQLSDFTADPGYQFQLQQGTRAVQQAAGLQGSPFGGNALQALDQFSQGLANTTYQQAFGRWQTQLGNLQNLAGLGFGAAQSGASLAGTTGGNMANIWTGGSANETNLANSQAQTNAGFWGSLF